MELIVNRDLRGEVMVKAHSEYGKAVFLECGYHNPETFCYDHHDMPGSETMLSIALQVQADLILRRKLPVKVVCNHVRHFDNMMAMYLLQYRSLAKHPDTLQLVSAADLIDRVGPLAISSVPQFIGSVLLTAQEQIPFKEFDKTMYTDEQIVNFALTALESLRGMVAKEIKSAKYELKYRSEDGLFGIVESNEVIGNTLYDQGYDAYVAFTKSGEGYKFTLARASEYVNFDILACFNVLNDLEAAERGITLTALRELGATWGGRAVVGGSPTKGGGTALSLETILEVLKKHYHG